LCSSSTIPAVATTATLSHRRRALSRKGRSHRRRGYAALPSRGEGRNPAGLPEGGRLRFAPGPPVQRQLKQCPGAVSQKRRHSCAAGESRHETAPSPTTWIRGPAEQRGGPRSSRHSQSWPNQMCTGATCLQIVQTVSWGRKPKEAALLGRRQALTRNGRPRQRRRHAVLPSSRTGRFPANLFEYG